MSEIFAHAEQIHVDGNLCSGHGLCYATAPEVFDCDDNGYSFVSASGPLEPQQVRQTLVAVDACPERAITVVTAPAPPEQAKSSREPATE